MTSLGRTFLAPAVLCIAVGCAGGARSGPSGGTARPQRREVVDRMHGVDVRDPFRWLEDEHAPEVRHYEQREDARTRRELARLPLLGSIRERLHRVANDLSPRSQEPPKSRQIVLRREPDEARARVIVRETDGKERVLLDPNTWGSRTLRKYTVSPDGELLAFTESHRNAERAGVRVVRVGSGELLPDRVEDLEDSLPTWLPDNQSFLYVQTDFRGDPATRFATEVVREHRLGTDAATDPILFAPTGDPLTSLQVTTTRDGRWCLVTVQHGAGPSELHLRDLRAPSSTWNRILSANTGANVTVQRREKTFLVLTDEGAANGQLFEVDPEAPDRARWKLIAGEDRSRALTRVVPTKDHLILVSTDDAVTRAVLVDADGGNPRVIPTPSPDTVWAWGGPDNTIDLSVSSPSRPPESWRVNMDTGITTVRSKEDRGVDLSAFVTERVFATSKDGTRIPMFVTRPRNQAGPLPTYFYGYGGFRVSLFAPFSPAAVPWLEHGGVTVVVCTRGGMEYGEAWHRAGMLRNKQNVFDDFLAAADHLVRTGVAESGRLAMKGWSNGGLLMGAVVTQRPDLFRAAVVGVPLADLIRFGVYGRGGMTELGDPADPEDFRALFAYSPYHHVEPHTQYPSLLITMAENDENAHPMHARKLAAAFQASDSKNPALLRVRWDAAHAGTGSALDAEQEEAEELAFLMDAVGMK